MVTELPDFAPDALSHTTDAARRAYVAEEVRRVVKAAPTKILLAVLACSDVLSQTIAIELLTRGVDDDGEQILEPRVWYLRLAEGARPPETDPQGRRLPPGKAGSVLVAKTGNKGGNVPNNAPPERLGRFNGPERAALGNARRDLYDTVEIGSDPKAFQLRDAVKLLRRYGVGVAEFADMHLLEEVDPATVQAKAKARSKDAGAGA
jgi:hypothetical protein